MEYIRVSELVENIDKLNKIIELHQNTTKDASMIKQYAFKRRENVLELQQIFFLLNLNIIVSELYHEESDDEVSNLFISKKTISKSYNIENPQIAFLSEPE